MLALETHYTAKALSNPMTTHSIELGTLESELNQLLKPWLFKDYCPNGLQVEGKKEIRKLISGVTASQALIDTALEHNADALLVHHGYFWRGEDASIVGMKKQRIQKLLSSKVSLFAYHLPLDMHDELGNNAQLGNLLGIATTSSTGRPGEPELVRIGELSAPLNLPDLLQNIEEKLGRTPLAIEGDIEKIKTVAWCTGAAQNYFELAIAAGADAFITGEISEPSAHIARESGVHFISAGHHATERYGVQAVGQYLAEKLDIEHEFIDIDNPA